MNHACVSKLMAGCICICVSIYLCISNQQERIELEMSQVCVWWPDGWLSVAMQQATNLSNQFEVETQILVLSIF